MLFRLCFSSIALKYSSLESFASKLYISYLQVITNHFLSKIFFFSVHSSYFLLLFTKLRIAFLSLWYYFFHCSEPLVVVLIVFTILFHSSVLCPRFSTTTYLELTQHTSTASTTYTFLRACQLIAVANLESFTYSINHGVYFQ